MKNLTIEILRSSIMALVLLVILCGIYPTLTWGIAQLTMKDKANGSLVTESGDHILGSTLIGQTFNNQKYFQSRPSAAGNGYDAALSGGSNLGSTSSRLADSLRARAANYRKLNQLDASVQIPSDAITSSASGLDPEISPTNAVLQAKRIAELRNIPIDTIQNLIHIYTRQPWLGILGEPGVNVLSLNMALDSYGK